MSGLLVSAACSDQHVESPTSPVTTSLNPTAFMVTEIPPEAQSRIRTEVVTKQIAPQTIKAPGNVALDLTKVAQVSSRIDGQVEQMYVRLGDRVKKGQPLLAIGSLKLDELIQRYLVSNVQVDLATVNFTRAEKLLKEKVISRRRFLDERAQYLESKAVFQHAREKLLNMGLSISELQELEHGSHLRGHRYTVKAPLSGTVESQNVVLGQGVAPGDRLFQLVDTSQVWVFANLPIEQARRFQEGDQGIVVPRGGEPITTRLAYIAPVAEESTRTVRIRFDVENPGKQLKPHEYVEVRFVDKQAPVPAIPISAVTMVDGVQGVFVDRQQGYDFVFVKLGRKGGGWAEVKSGVVLGDRVVTEGVFDLKNALLKTAVQGE